MRPTKLRQSVIDMSAPKGNKFWEMRSSHGRKPLFDKPEDLWEAATEYFQWVEDNPLWEAKAFAYQGVVTQEIIPKMRAMTLEGLCLFLDIGKQSWLDYCAKEDFSCVTKKIGDVIRTQKFEGAAADLLNANIIARELGLRDNLSQEVAGPGGGAIPAKITIELIKP